MYTAFVYCRCDKQNQAATPTVSVQAGWHTWQAKNCQSCHQLYGLGGYLGPDLTNVASAPGKNEAYLKVFILNGTGRMPCFHLNDKQANEVVAFLQWVDKSGKNFISANQVTWSGNYNLSN